MFAAWYAFVDRSSLFALVSSPRTKSLYRMPICEPPSVLNCPLVVIAPEPAPSCVLPTIATDRFAEVSPVAMVLRFSMLSDPMSSFVSQVLPTVVLRWLPVRNAAM